MIEHRTLLLFSAFIFRGKKVPFTDRNNQAVGNILLKGEKKDSADMTCRGAK